MSENAGSPRTVARSVKIEDVEAVDAIVISGLSIGLGKL